MKNKYNKVKLKNSGLTTFKCKNGVCRKKSKYFFFTKTVFNPELWNLLITEINSMICKKFNPESTRHIYE